MSYTPTTWANGDTITATKLNNAEQGIVNAGIGFDAVITYTSDIPAESTYTLVSGDLTTAYNKFVNGSPILVAFVWDGSTEHYVPFQSYNVSAYEGTLEFLGMPFLTSAYALSWSSNGLSLVHL